MSIDSYDSDINIYESRRLGRQLLEFSIYGCGEVALHTIIFPRCRRCKCCNCCSVVILLRGRFGDGLAVGLGVGWMLWAHNVER
jgi:hypothetical protein